MDSSDGIIPGQWLVRVKPYLSDDDQANHIAQINELTADSSTQFNVQVDQELSLPSVKGYVGTFDDATKADLESLPQVIAIEPQQAYTHCDTTQTDAPWGLARLNNTGPLPKTGPYNYKYRADATGLGVTAYVIDTGINHHHVEFEGRAFRGPKFVTGFPTVDEDVLGHGTHVSGTIAGKTFGVAKKATIVGIKVFNDAGKNSRATTGDIVAALQHVLREVKSFNPPRKAVVNLSLGGGRSDFMDDAVADLVRGGIPVIVAAGNSNIDADLGSPARVPHAITVGATDLADKRATFSNHGSKIDIFAPGEGIESAWPLEEDETAHQTIQSNKAKQSLSGTSMASPHVAGIVASLLTDPTWVDRDPNQVVGKLLIDADKGGVGNLDVPRLTLNPKYTTIPAISQKK